MWNKKYLLILIIIIGVISGAFFVVNQQNKKINSKLIVLGGYIKNIKNDEAILEFDNSDMENRERKIGLNGNIKCYNYLDSINLDLNNLKLLETEDFFKKNSVEINFSEVVEGDQVAIFLLDNDPDNMAKIIVRTKRRKIEPISADPLLKEAEKSFSGIIKNVSSGYFEIKEIEGSDEQLIKIYFDDSVSVIERKVKTIDEYVREEKNYNETENQIEPNWYDDLEISIKELKEEKQVLIYYIKEDDRNIAQSIILLK